VTALLLAFGFWLLLRAGNAPVVDSPEPVATAAPQPVPIPPKPQPVSDPRCLVIRLVSAGGRELGRTMIDPRQRRAVLRHRTNDGHQSVFVAEQANRDGTWTYRRVGVERES